MIRKAFDCLREMRHNKKNTITNKRANSRTRYRALGEYTASGTCTAHLKRLAEEGGRKRTRLQKAQREEGSEPERASKKRMY
jgi:hypothetical protein